MNGGEACRVFYEDVYLYDLNRPQAAPLAYRSAAAGKPQPTLPALLGIGERELARLSEYLYEMPLCLSSGGGAVVLPAFGSIGRFALVVKCSLSLQSMACLAQRMGACEVYTDPDLQHVIKKAFAKQSRALESAVQTVESLRLLCRACESADNPYEMQECISLAVSVMGVALREPRMVEFEAMQGQVAMPEMQYSGQALLVSLLTLLSAMRNQAHARSGWLYPHVGEAGVTLQAVLRCDGAEELACLTHLRMLLEDGGAVLGMRRFAAPVKPPRQYAYLHKKITDPRHPFCAACGCLDRRCAACTAVQWALLPYVCDAALLGIKNYFDFT